MTEKTTKENFEKTVNAENLSEEEQAREERNRRVSESIKNGLNGHTVRKTPGFGSMLR